MIFLFWGISDRTSDRISMLIAPAEDPYGDAGDFSGTGMSITYSDDDGDANGFPAPSFAITPNTVSVQDTES